MALDLRQGVVAGGRQCRAYRPVHVAAFCPAGCLGTESDAGAGTTGISASAGKSRS